MQNSFFTLEQAVQVRATIKYKPAQTSSMAQWLNECFIFAANDTAVTA